MSENKMVSPNELWEAGRKQMLDGNTPTTTRDFMLMVNFIAANIIKGCEVPVCKIMKSLYNIPLEDELVEGIAQFQMEAKN